MQGTQVRSLVQEDPTCHGATKSAHHNYWAHTLELLKPVRSRACMPQLLSLHDATIETHVPRACALQQEKPPRWGACAPQRRVAPACRNQRKAHAQQWRPMQPKIRKTKQTKKLCWASLVAQWLRICLLMQGTRVRALVWEDPTCCGATRPVSHNCWACASGACAPRQERPWQWEARAPWWRVAPACHN